MTATVSTGRPEDRAETDRIEALKCVTDEFAEKLTATAPAAPPPLTLDGLCGLIESLTTTVICHPDRADTVRAGLAGIPLVRVVESPYLPDPDSAYVFRPTSLEKP